MNRVKYYDLLRIGCFSIVIICHLLMQLFLDGIWPKEMVMPLYTYTNINIGAVAVGIFFMLSGAGLMLSTKKDFKVFAFYKKRLVRLLIPFYVTYILVLLYRLIVLKDLYTTYSEGVGGWRIIFTFFGMDEWLLSQGVRTYSLGIGEWFLGCLIILYLLFPLFKFLLERYRWVFMAILTVGYILLAIFYPFETPEHMSIFFKGYEFILGMFIATAKKIDKKWLIITIPTLLVLMFWPTVIPISNAFKITIMCVIVFVSLSFIEPLLTDKKWTKVLAISNFTYPVFLIHHQVIYKMTPVLKPYVGSRTSILLMFLAEIAVIIILAFLIDILSKQLDKLIFKKKAKVS